MLSLAIRTPRSEVARMNDFVCYFVRDTAPMTDGDSPYAVPLDELLSSHVPLEETSETQPQDRLPGPLNAEEADRRRLLNDPAGAGRLHPE